MISVLCGGVGAARLLRAIRDYDPHLALTGVVNVADDLILHGLSICPDIDTITYTLAGLDNRVTGWGVADESWRVMDELSDLGGSTWFRLGDRDLATHLYRTQRLGEGATKSDVTRELAARRAVSVQLLPVTDDPIATVLDTDQGRLSFQEYFVRHHHEVTVSAVHYEGASTARATDDVLDALHRARRIVVAPSNPILSIGPVLAVEPLRDLLVGRRADVIAVSPIVAGAALKGPADRLMRELGLPANALGVAQYYEGVIGTLVIDERDADLAEPIRATGIECVVTSTVMDEPGAAARLAEVVTR